MATVKAKVAHQVSRQVLAGQTAYVPKQSSVLEDFFGESGPHSSFDGHAG